MNVQQTIELLEAADNQIQRMPIVGDVMFDFHNQLQDMIAYLEEQAEPEVPWSIDDNRC